MKNPKSPLTPKPVSHSVSSQALVSRAPRNTGHFSKETISFLGIDLILFRKGIKEFILCAFCTVFFSRGSGGHWHELVAAHLVTAHKDKLLNEADFSQYFEFVETAECPRCHSNIDKGKLSAHYELFHGSD